MRLIVLLFFFHAAQSNSEVSGYIGYWVTLPSPADPPWQLSSVKWYVYSNDTMIATCRNGSTNTDRFHLFKDRLSLDCTTGDLKIFNLSREDALVYTVELTSTEQKSKEDKIKLNLRHRLKTPTINKLFSHPADGGCWVGLRCDSQDEGIGLSWNVDPEPRTLYPQNHPDTNMSVILTFLNNSQNDVQFTCTSSRDPETTRDVVFEPCPGNDSARTAGGRSRLGLVVAGAFVAGPTLLIFVKYFIEKHKTSGRR